MQDRDHAVGLGRAQARHHLVEQQQLRLGGERARDLQPLAVGQRERRGALAALVVEVEPAQHLVRVRARIARVAAMQQRADDDIVLDRERRERPHDLEGAADAAPADLVGRQAVDALAGESDRAAVGRVDAGDHVEQSGLAGAVRADHREDRALRHLEADLVDREQAAEALADRLDRKQRAHGALSGEAEPAREPRPDAVRQRHDHQQQADAVEHLLGAGHVDAERTQRTG